MIKDEPPFDIAIIGGGISGIGIALEARKRGLRTALLEKNTLCGETSNAFLRVIHGGLRYLQKLDIPRTYESAYEQGILLNRYPEHIENLPCIMPLSKWGLKSKYPVFVGSLLYGGIKSLSGNRLPYPRIVNSKQAGIYAGLNTSTFQNGALIWHDAVVKDPASFTNTLKAECLNQSVSLLMPAFVKSIQRTNDLFEVTFLDSDNQDLIIRCRTCVNATGPWIHGFDKPKVITTKKYVWAKSFNVILNRPPQSQYAIGAHNKGRVYFCVPRGHQTAVGTDYLPFDGDPTNVSITPPEIEDFVNRVNGVFSAFNFNTNELDHCEIGVLPVKSIDQNKVSFLGDELLPCDNGYIEVVSIKYTTFQSLGRRVLDKLSSFLKK